MSSSLLLIGILKGWVDFGEGIWFTRTNLLYIIYYLLLGWWRILGGWLVMGKCLGDVGLGW
jgi:hypothetical protein